SACRTEECSLLETNRVVGCVARAGRTRTSTDVEKRHSSRATHPKAEPQHCRACQELWYSGPHLSAYRTPSIFFTAFRRDNKTQHCTGDRPTNSCAKLVSPA